MPLDIVIAPAKVLTRPARKVLPAEAQQLRQLYADMLETVHERGVGLAAPQVGQGLRMFLAMDPDTKEYHPYLNPQILSASARKAVGSEGCLSIPGFYANVERHLELVLRWQDLDFQPHEGRFLDYHARIIQHENDHLNGVLLFDRAIDGMHPEEPQEKGEEVASEAEAVAQAHTEPVIHPEPVSAPGEDA
jgi:peptide deformylase